LNKVFGQFVLNDLPEETSRKFADNMSFINQTLSISTEQTEIEKQMLYSLMMPDILLPPTLSDLIYFFSMTANLPIVFK
jgi:hypothetical protein